MTTALTGEPASMIMRDRQGKLVIGVAVPVQHLRVVRAALLVTASGETIEDDIEAVQYGFFQIFVGTLFVTMLLGVYLARSIIGPVTVLARAADAVRLSKANTLSLPKMFDRRDEIGDLARDLAAMTEELQNRMQATASFAADVSHEIKNPLSSLRSAVETISRIEDEQKRQALMDIILADVQRLDRLISDISAASRIDADLSTANFPQLILPNLSETCRCAAASGPGQAQDKGQGQHADQPVMANVIADRLVQVLDNLLPMPDPSAPMAVSSRSVLMSNRWRQSDAAVITMRDQGPGIPEAKTEAIFHGSIPNARNQRLSASIRVGAVHFRSIIEAHGGQLSPVIMSMTAVLQRGRDENYPAACSYRRGPSVA